MREILFRGKRVYNGEWIEGSLVVWPDGNKDICVHESQDASMFACTVIPETVGQYTGLLDKNGKRIFEGDILQFDYVGQNRGVNGTAVVSFQDGKFGVEWGWHKEFVCLDAFANTTKEIVGNIYDDPELTGDSDQKRRYRRVLELMEAQQRSEAEE